MNLLFTRKRCLPIIKINRLTDNLDRHISENELDILKPDDYNGVLDNNGSKADLYVKIRRYDKLTYFIRCFDKHRAVFTFIDK